MFKPVRNINLCPEFGRAEGPVSLQKQVEAASFSSGHIFGQCVHVLDTGLDTKIRHPGHV